MFSKESMYLVFLLLIFQLENRLHLIMVSSPKRVDVNYKLIYCGFVEIVSFKVIILVSK